MPEQTGRGCGRPGRIVAAVDGRQEDYVELGNGARVGRMDHVFKDLTNIREAQIVQSRPGELEVRVVRGGAYTALDERELLKGGPSGKLRFVVSEIPDAKLENAAK